MGESGWVNIPGIDDAETRTTLEPYMGVVVLDMRIRSVHLSGASSPYDNEFLLTKIRSTRL